MPTSQNQPTPARSAQDPAPLAIQAPWRLAYLESLVRAADALASQDIGAVESMSNEAAE